jgi:hypothetical protein
VATVNLKVAAGWLDRVRGDVRGAAMKAALSAAALGVRDIQAVIIPGITPHPPINKDIYRMGWKFQKIDDGARIYNRVYPQAPLIEFGVRAGNVKPGRAMIIALAEWVAQKGLAFKNANDTLESVAWAIAKSMQKRGIFNQGGSEGFHIIDKAIPGMLKEFQAAFVRYMSGSPPGTGSLRAG